MQPRMRESPCFVCRFQVTNKGLRASVQLSFSCEWTDVREPTHAVPYTAGCPSDLRQKLTNSRPRSQVAAGLADQAEQEGFRSKRQRGELVPCGQCEVSQLNQPFMPYTYYSHSSFALHPCMLSPTRSRPCWGGPVSLYRMHIILNKTDSRSALVQQVTVLIKACSQG